MGAGDMSFAAAGRPVGLSPDCPLPRAGESAADRRRIGIACIVAGAVLSAFGAWDWLTALAGSGTYCFGHTCYTTIAEGPNPIYYVGLVIAGAVPLAIGILLIARGGGVARAGRAPIQ